jgi:hypothetical protein
MTRGRHGDHVSVIVLGNPQNCFFNRSIDNFDGLVYTAILSDASIFLEDRAQITSEQVAQQLLGSRLAVARISQPRFAESLKDLEIRPVVVHPTKRADHSRHGYRAAQFEDAFARFLPPEPNIRNTQAWERRKDVKVFGCSDDRARCGTAKVDCMPTNA